LLLGSGPAFASDGSWNTDADGNWNVNGNWTGATFPNAVGDDATLGAIITADRTITLGQDITIRTLTVNDNNRYTITGGNTLTFVRNGVQFTQSGAGGVTIDSDVILGNDGTWNGAGTGTAIFNGVISDGGSGYAITKGGTSTLILNGNNTFSGGMTLNAGTVEFGDDGAAGTGTLDLSGSAIQAGGGARTLANTVVVTGATTVGGSDDLTLSGDMTLTGNRTFTIDNTGDTTFSGVISGAFRLTKDGAGLLILDGNNTYSGGLRINDGTVEFGNDGAAGTGTLTINAGTIQAGGGARNINEAVTVGGNFSVGGSNDLTLSGAMALGAATRTITVDNTGATVFSGVISGGGGITKAGSGTLTLNGSANNTFSGATTINAGTLELAASGALNATSAVTVNSGGTLLFSGTTTTRIGDTVGITLAGGTLTSQDATETMGTLTLTAASVINLGTDGGNDDLTFANLVDSGGSVVIYNWTGQQYSSGTDDRIFVTGAAVGTIFGDVQFAGFNQGAIVLASFELVPIPEPSTVIAGVLLIGLIAFSIVRSRLTRAVVRVRKDQ